MADNVNVNPGVDPGAKPVATDDVGGVQYQRVKLDVGGDGLTVPVMGAVPIAMGDSQSVDAFGRVRVSFPDAVFEVTHQYDLNPRRVGLQRQDAATTITHVTPTAVLAVPAIAGRRICHQAHRYHIYQPGKSTLVKVTGQLGDTTILAGMGYGDDDDGIFLERTSTGFQIRFSSSTTADAVVTQANWNVDKLDGTGVSGLTLDGAFSQQFTIDLQWLGVGRVRVGFVLNGGLHYCHYFNFGNAIVGPYMRTGSLPIRWYAESLGAAGSMTAICGAVTSEGGHTPEGRHFGYAMGTAKAAGAAGVRTPFLSIRPKATFNALTNRAHILPSGLRVLVTTADSVLIEVVRNATTLTGATWAIDPNSESHAELDLAATVIAGGEVLWCDFISSTNRDVDANELLQWPLTLKADGTADTFTICATRIAGAVSLHCGINWKEMY